MDKGRSDTKKRSGISKLGRLLKAGIVAGICGVGLCALGRRLDIPTRLAEVAQSIETAPLPGGKLYSVLMARHLRPLYAAIARQIAAEGCPDKVLDINTGAGYLPMEIARVCPAISVFGVDESPNLIRLAGTTARAGKVSRSVEFSTAEPAKLPFPGRYFDLAVSVNAMHHWQEPALVLEEVYHVLKPGGEFMIIDYRSDLRKEVWSPLQSDLPVQLRPFLLAGPIASSKAAFDKRKILTLVGETRFADPRIEEVSLPLFGRTMPVFNLIRLRKPEQARG